MLCENDEMHNGVTGIFDARVLKRSHIPSINVATATMDYGDSFMVLQEKPRFSSPYMVVGLAVVLIILGCGLLSYLLISLLGQSLTADMALLRAGNEALIVDALRGRVEAAIVVARICDETIADDAEAQIEAKTIIQNMHYDVVNYLWVHQLNPENPAEAFMLVHPATELVDRDLTGLIDLARLESVYLEGEIIPLSHPDASKLVPKDIFSAFNTTCLNEGGGMVDYFWPKVRRGTAGKVGFRKMSYVLYYEPWHWVIGTGAYSDVIDEKVAEKVAASQERHHHLVRTAVTYVGSVGLLLILFTSVGLWRIFSGHVLALRKEIIHRQKAQKLLEQQEQELRELNNNLEQKVEERTTELKAANVELLSLNETILRNQEQMVQSEKMASLGLLAAGVAHEINNPIGFVKSNIGTLREYFYLTRDLLGKYQACEAMLEAEQHSAKMAKQLTDIKDFMEKEDFSFIMDDLEKLLAETDQGTDRIAEIVQGLKSFSRVDCQDRQLVDLNECLESTRSMVWNELKYHCKVEMELGDIPEFLCNAGKMCQVFMNFFINAGQAINGQGTITVRSFFDGKAIKIVFHDTGCGIDPKLFDKIFTPFFTTKEVGKGTGLGLSISSGIITDHNGSISVESTLGKGTSFTISLPLNDIEEAVEHVPTDGEDYYEI